jgi:hypothetical protein
MKSEIWRVFTERIGSIEGFKSERDMQAFLMNNPAIVGCWDPDSRDSLPSLVREEVFSRAGNEIRGRMDMVGVTKNEEGEYELRIFELKVGEIDSSAVRQLDSYLKAWVHEEGPKTEIKNWILNLGLQGIDDATVGDIIDRPTGVLVGSKFSAEAIKQALELNIKGIRLARFKGSIKSEHEYYVIIEDQVGRNINPTRKFWSWQQLIDARLVQLSDEFSISFEGKKLIVKPDEKYLNYNWIRVIFDNVSRNTLLAREEQIMGKADNNARRWVNKALTSLKKGEGVWLSNATGFCYLAFGGPTASYWNPTGWWKHERTGKRLIDLVKDLNK